MIVGDSPLYPLGFRLAARAVYVLHIGGGLTGIVSGLLVLAGPKAGRWHRRAGTVFFVSMLIMSAIGAAVSPFIPQRANVVPGLFTFYLTATAWATMRLQGVWARRFTVVAMAGAAGACALGVGYALAAAGSPTGLLDAEPPKTYLIFAAFPAFAAMLDMTMIWRGAILGAARLARHLWRMSLALFVACGSFFLGQPRVFPPALRGSALLLAPEFVVIGLMVFWLVRIRIRAGLSRPLVARLGPAKRRRPKSRTAAIHLDALA